ncbi:hypothetical protein SAMN04490248_11525 [Salinihabitans flavidus]|uniref:Tellurium resistance protein n=1 Tax=Salinihabitans flavidus TaxID=569882 RepID=A0A1H8TDH1_9RHOB|nr:TrgA family protein [Salinihabitans flavidus]SEO88875.1 hypothetical protein SAMN04490248_11525 [Salinihabitans flavidus]
MPTAARLVAAVFMAVLGAVVSELVKPELPEGTGFGYFTLVNAAIGAFVGWTTIGKRVGRGITAAINHGLTGAVVLVMLGLFVQGCNEMLRVAMRSRYDGPVEAVVSVFELMAKFGLYLLTPGIISALAIGGILAGLAAEGASRRWR